MTSTIKYLATVTKGLENIAAREIQNKLPKAKIEEVLSKRIIFSYSGDILELKNLRTVDDVDILLSVDPEQALEHGTITDLKTKITKVRNLQNSFSLTLSQKASKLDISEIKANLIAQIQKVSSLEYSEISHTNLDFRIFIDGDSFSLSVRVFEMPISHRGYKTDSTLGSLKPSIAASMVFLVTDLIGDTNNDEKSDRKIQDPRLIDLYCGSGTILAEGYLSGFEVFGSDINHLAIEVSKTNLGNLKIHGLDDKIRVYDAQRTKWNSDRFDVWVSNMPWDKQIKVDKITELYKKTMEETARILKPNGKICVLVHRPELFIKLAKKYFPNYEFKTYQLGYLGQQPSIIHSI